MGFRKLAALASLVLLAACQEDSPTTLSPAEETACEARGGRVASAGLSNDFFCAEATPDAGQSCRRESDCEAYCEAETRSCASHFYYFGCYSFLDENGEEATICAD